VSLEHSNLLVNTVQSNCAILAGSYQSVPTIKLAAGEAGDYSSVTLQLRQGFDVLHLFAVHDDRQS
jgi:hypothetical protein